MYRNLRGLMAKYGLTQKDLAEVLGIKKETLSMKINKRTPFTLNEAITILDFFVGLGEKTTMEYIFLTNTSDKTEIKEG